MRRFLPTDTSPSGIAWPWQRRRDAIYHRGAARFFHRRPKMTSAATGKPVAAD